MKQGNRNKENSKKSFGILPISLLIVLIILSLSVRCRNLNSPLQEEHGFRQTQTAITVWYYLHDGIDLLHPKTPVFGAPWEVPFEFPLFQCCAALLIKATGMPVDMGCRATSIIFFYLSAWALWALCRLYLDKNASALILLFYLWIPFNIFWSRTSMIEFAAMNFALWYLYFLLRWLRSPDRWGWIIGAVLTGAVGAAVKITTMFTIVPAALVFIIYYVRQWYRAEPKERKFSSIGALIALLAAIFIPMACGAAWTMHADHIKAASPMTDWMTSAKLKAWNFGTVELYTNPDAWKQLAFHFYGVTVPYWYAILPVIALILTLKKNKEELILVTTVFAGLVIPPVLLFNLYKVHTYYFCAITPWAALLIGYAFHELVRTRPETNLLGRLSGIFIILMLTAAGFRSTIHHWKPALAYAYTLDYRSCEVCAVSETVKSLTKPDDRIAISGMDWNPSIPYYAERKAMMFKFPHTVDLPESHKKEYTLFVIYGDLPEYIDAFPDRQYLASMGKYEIYRINTGARAPDK